MLRSSESKVSLAKKDYLPNFSLGVAYTQREVLRNGAGGVDYFSAMASVNIPVYFWRKQSKKVRETELILLSVENAYANVRNQVFAALEKTLTDVEKNNRLMELFRTGIIPQASQSLNSALAGYQVDKVDFLTLLNNEITLFNYELDYYRVFSEYYKGLAELEALAGVSLVK